MSAALQSLTANPVAASTTVPAALAAVLKPPRVNFAQVCMWCGRRWCQSPTCVANHAATLWMVCIRCDGFGAVTGCSLCINGVIEATEAGVRAQADRVLAASSDELPTHACYVVADPR